MDSDADFLVNPISENSVTVNEKISDVGALIEAQKALKNSKMTETPTTFAYDVYYDYDEVRSFLSIATYLAHRPNAPCHGPSGHVRFGQTLATESVLIVLSWKHGST